jgi:hypothetical protein
MPVRTVIPQLGYEINYSIYKYKLSHIMIISNSGYCAVLDLQLSQRFTGSKVLPVGIESSSQSNSLLLPC